MAPKPDPDAPSEPTPPTVDEWGLPVPPAPSWLDALDPDDDLGYCTGDDPQDRW